MPGPLAPGWPAKRALRYKLWRNWGGTVLCRPERTLFPESTEAVAEIVRHARRAGRRVRPVGAGYSYTPLVQTDHDLVSLDALTGVEHVDLDAGTAVVRAGTRLGDLMDALAVHGAALANLGDIDKQSVAGAIATGTHGTGIGIGSMSDQTVALTLVDGTGAVRELSAAQTPDLFPAAQIGLGALGIVTSVTLRVQRHYHLRVQRGVEGLESVLANLDRHVRENRNFEFFWFPDATRGMAYTKRMNEAPAAHVARSTFARASTGAIRFVNDVVLENAVMWAACEMVARRPQLRSGWLTAGRALMPRDVTVAPAERAYATPRLVKHYEVEYAVPFARAGEALDALDALLRSHPLKTLFPIEVRFARAEQIPLSATAGQDVVWVAVHAYSGEDYQELFDRCEDCFLRFGGRPHWGKLHSLRAPELAALYPRWAEFQAARERLDPDDLFGNGYLTRLLGPRSRGAPPPGADRSGTVAALPGSPTNSGAIPVASATT